MCGTSSGAGKSTVVTGLCRLLFREGRSVAPFKAQNMSNQSAVTADGAEIGRAQFAQALAAGAVPEAAMNPVLLKPTGERTSQVVVLGRAVGTTDAWGWGDHSKGAPSLLPVVGEALASLRARFDVVVAEGAGSPAELNLLDRDIANLPLAVSAGLPAVLVADIDRGGVFASVAGTFAVLPRPLRARIRAVIVNKLRGDPELFGRGGVETLERVAGVPVLGVLPWLDGHLPDEEDSLDLGRVVTSDDVPGADLPLLDVAVVRFPRIANATDLDAVHAEPAVRVRYVTGAHDLGAPHLVVLPGTKATVADLAWLRARQLDHALFDLVARGRTTVLGICGGLQMLGKAVTDDGVESGSGTVLGLDQLAVSTTFGAGKVVRTVRGTVLDRAVSGYELRHGEVVPEEILHRSDDGRWWGTSVHGILDADGFRSAFLTVVADQAGLGCQASGVVWADRRRAHHDRLADWLAGHLDIGRLASIIADGAT
ncbi:cobyric acid synthase [soil metagenome]